MSKHKSNDDYVPSLQELARTIRGMNHAFASLDTILEVEADMAREEATKSRNVTDSNKS